MYILSYSNTETIEDISWVYFIETAAYNFHKDKT
jgi:hypothetical protein